LADLTLPLKSLDELAVIPVTTIADLCRDPLAQLSVSQDRIACAVTLETFGTMGNPKRLFLMDADPELTVDFFHHGMSTLVATGERVLILMPGNLPGSVSGLLVNALERMKVQGVAQQAIDRVHSPIGLAIGAETPEEIAVSIVAELIAVRAGATP